MVGRLDLTAVALDGDALIETACERTGLDDLGGSEFREGFDRLLDGLQHEARLSEVGQMAAPELLIPYLTTRLELHDWHTRHPEIGQVELSPVVFMIGMGRTGTTIVHDLLAQDPRNRVPRTWEVDRPFPPPETATYDTDPRIDEVQAGIDATRSMRPELQAMHPMGARLAQECVRITGCEFASLIFLSQFHSESYLHWLTREADMSPAYALHRRFLQLLQWKHAGDRWVLKSGAHLWAIPAMLEQYPDARFVQTHRDPGGQVGPDDRRAYHCPGRLDGQVARVEQVNEQSGASGVLVRVVGASVPVGPPPEAEEAPEPPEPEDKKRGGRKRKRRQPGTRLRRDSTSPWG